MANDETRSQPLRLSLKSALWNSNGSEALDLSQFLLRETDGGFKQDGLIPSNVASGSSRLCSLVAFCPVTVATGEHLLYK